MNANASLDPPQFQRIATALRYLDDHFHEQPSLEVLSTVVGLSVAHFDRLFHRWAGLTPKRYLQQLTLEAARLELDRGASVIAAAWAAGLSGSSRLHDLFVVAEGTTPGEYRAGGAGVELWYGLTSSPFGNVFVAGTTRGLAHLAFVDDAGAAAAEFQLAQGKWPEAHWREAPSEAAALVERLWGAAGPQGCVLEVRGTAFQMQVWRALLRQPRARTYGELAVELGRPSAARAVGGAVGDNSLAWVIPCHHVLRRGALLGGYRWGLDRKRAMLTYEHASRLAAAG
jgi:AraC family transcriptional regulator of adaptative response/methylated-DNA-[protein]-cysteine methyltransferase